MNERADHPHQAAVHLMKALKCCQECSQTDQISLIEIRQLEYRKNMLAEQLRQISIRGESIELLQNEIRQLDELIVRLQEQNNRLQQQGLNRIQLAVEQRKMFQNEEMATLITQLQIQVQSNKQLKLQMQAVMEKVRYLNRVNNQLVFKFTNL